MSIAVTSHAPCSRATRMCGWKRSGVPSTRSPHASGRRRRSGKWKPNGRRRLLRRPNQCWFSNRTLRRLNEAAKRTLARDTIWQGNCDATDYPLRSTASLPNTKSIEYPLSNCPAKSGRLPSNVSIRSGPAIWTPRRAQAPVRRVTPDRVIASSRTHSAAILGIIRFLVMEERRDPSMRPSL
jgi:hypothetical protein